MEQITQMLLKSLCISALMMGYYWLVLRHSKMHTFNRVYLLLSAVLAIGVPFLHFDFCVPDKTDVAPTVKLLQFVAGGEDEQVGDIRRATASWSIYEMLLTGYAAVSMSLLVWLLYNVASIYRVRRQGSVTHRDGYNMVVTSDSRAPFSFFGNVFWKDGLDEHSEAGSLIMKHELVHMRQWHTLDKLAMQVAIALCWFNPFLWLAHRELAMVHEFLADEEAIQDNDTSALATMLLEPYYKSALPVMINPFYSSIKQRIMMLSKTNKTSYRNLRRAMIVPLMVVPIMLFSFRVHKVAATTAKEPITLVLDAGHGGKDNGADVNGVNEKDINLRACNRLQKMAAGYNVKVVETRPTDDYVTLQDRVTIASEYPKAVFVSLHASRDTHGAAGQIVPAKNGVEIIVSSAQSNIAESQLLASSVAGAFRGGSLQTSLTQRGIHVLKANPHPAILIEMGNMSNALDLSRLQSDQELDNLCRNILSGVVAYSNAH